MENLAETAGSESTFLPFSGAGGRFHNFALLTELLKFVAEEKKIDELFSFVSDSVLNAYQVQGLYLLKQREGRIWKLTEPNSSVEQEIHLSGDHAIVTSLGSGAVAITSTNGWGVGLDAGSLVPDSDSYQLLLIPLIDNLIPRLVLVAVLKNCGPYTPADLELFALLQVILSFVAYGGKPLDSSYYEF